MVLEISKSQVGTKAKSFDQFEQGQINLIMFICNHCPYVKFRMPAISKLVNDYKDQVNIIAFNSNDSKEYPEDAPEHMPAFAEKWKLNCQYIFDNEQNVAKQYNVICTPEFFIVNKKGMIVYHGELDPAHTSNNLIPSGSSLRHALDLTLIEKDISWVQNPSFGCSIKWKNEQ